MSHASSSGCLVPSFSSAAFARGVLRRPHPGGPENHAVSAARSGNAAAETVGMRRCCPIVVTPLVQWRSDIWAILLVI